MRNEDALIPLFSLSAITHQRGRPTASDIAVILTHRTGPFAVTVDAAQNPRPVTFTHLEDLPFRSSLLRGVSVLADGGTMQLLDVEALRQAADPTRSVTGAKTRIRAEPHALVVEDAPVARELLSGLLRSFGLRVTEAVDGRDGLARAMADRPDLVLTDLEMPYLDGLQLISRLRSEPATADVPIVVLTTRSDAETEARARALGVAAFLSKKSFVEERLREVVEDCLRDR
jgi:two-component system chemotaxis sensor kinase CheA